MATGVHKDFLQRETERQNRIYQEAVARKKKQVSDEEPRAKAEIGEKNTWPDLENRFEFGRDSAARPAGNGNASPTPAEKAGSTVGPAGSAASQSEPAQEWSDWLTHIPEMRSALMPLDAPDAGADWSKPFSLARADMEPWLSFYKGYKQSRLFLEASADPATDASLSLDFAVRALLELKQADSKVILEPPVRINGQVVYAELDQELRACRNELEAKRLIKSAGDIHETQLRKAAERGREMGNLLYDVLMGEGHVNLIHAWEESYKRKPTVEELHLMLTTGRTKKSVPRRPSFALDDERTDPVKLGEGEVRERRVPLVEKEASPSISPAARVNTTPGKKLSWLEKRLASLSPRHRMLVPILVAAFCCAVLVALGLRGLI